MAMPAVQALATRVKHADPEAAVTVLTKESLVPLWRLNPTAGDLIVLHGGVVGTRRTVNEVRARGFDRACVLSHSMRSALIPYIARVPVRAGTLGQKRGWLLNRPVEPEPAPGREHLSFEYLKVAGLEGGAVGKPRLAVPAGVLATCRARLGLGEGAAARRLAAIIPGAARGPSKRWPEERFAEVGRRLAKEAGCRIVACGTGSERALCDEVAAAAGPSALNLAGETTLPELVAVLSFCSVAVANDSGGMHLAAAAGSTVVAVFGVTDPAVTGPIGEGHRIVRAAGGKPSRSVSRRSGRARASLESVSEDEVFRAAVGVLVDRNHHAD
jgi:heptosyltransferase-2